jgi:hypothetical protein
VERDPVSRSAGIGSTSIRSAKPATHEVTFLNTGAAKCAFPRTIRFLDETRAHPTPEEVATEAMADIPSARPVGVTYSDDGTEATAEFTTNNEPYLYPYYVRCFKDQNGVWQYGDDHNYGRCLHNESSPGRGTDWRSCDIPEHWRRRASRYRN